MSFIMQHQRTVVCSYTCMASQLWPLSIFTTCTVCGVANVGVHVSSVHTVVFSQRCISFVSHLDVGRDLYGIVRSGM